MYKVITPVCQLLLIALLSFGAEGFAAQDPKEGPGCALVFGGIDLTRSQGQRAVGLRVLSDPEIDGILARIQSDPTLAAFQKVMQRVLPANPAFARAVTTRGTPESTLVLSYLRWIHYRVDKPEIVSKEKNEEAARLDPAFQKINAMEIMDQLILRVLEEGKSVPAPIVRLLTELMQGGVERMQVGADTWMMNGSLSDIVKTLEYLRTGAKVETRELYLAIMKFWDLDGGAPVAVQKSLEEFTPEEKAFFVALDPNSPLTLPSRHYSDKEVQSFRSTFRGTPLSQLTPEQCDRVWAENNKWTFVPNDAMDFIASHYPGKQFRELTIEQIDAVLPELGRMTMMELAKKMRSKFRVNWEQEVPASLQDSAPAPGIYGNSATTYALTTTSHPVALALATPAEYTGYSNVGSQLTTNKAATPRIESALKRFASGSPEFFHASELYRTYMNMALYSPQRLANSKGSVDVLVVAALEHGTQREQTEVADYIHLGAQRMRDLTWAATYNKEAEGYREVMLALLNLINTRQVWDMGSLRFTLDTLGRLTSLTRAQDLSAMESVQILERISEMRRNEPLRTDKLDAFFANPSDTTIRYGVLEFKLKISKEAPGMIVEIHNIKQGREAEIDDRVVIGDQFMPQLLRLERDLKARGATGYRIVAPTLHIMRFLAQQNRYQETKFEKPFGQHKHMREESIFYRSLTAPTYDTTSLKTALLSGRLESIVRLGIFQLELRMVAGNMVSPKRGRTLFIMRVDSDNMGSGEYGNALSTIERVARENGYGGIVIDVVGDPRHWAFYERHGYQVRRTHGNGAKDFQKEL